MENAGPPNHGRRDELVLRLKLKHWIRHGYTHFTSDNHKNTTTKVLEGSCGNCLHQEKRTTVGSIHKIIILYYHKATLYFRYQERVMVSLLIIGISWDFFFLQFPPCVRRISSVYSAIVDGMQTTKLDKTAKRHRQYAEPLCELQYVRYQSFIELGLKGRQR